MVWDWINNIDKTMKKDNDLIKYSKHFSVYQN